MATKPIQASTTKAVDAITLLMAENTRTGFVWDLFMQNPEARNAMQMVGFRESGLA